MARHLKRKVLIKLMHEPEREVRRKCTRPAMWRAQIASGGPRTGTFTGHGITREEAVEELLGRLRAAGYTGNARVVQG